MTLSTFRQKRVIWVLVLGTWILTVVGTAALAGDLPEHVKEAVENRYPAAIVMDIRQENWKGEMAFEVEIKARDGKMYELIISREGDILGIEEEEGLPWIGGELTIGAGALVETDIYKGVGSEVGPAFFFNMRTGTFRSGHLILLRWRIQSCKWMRSHFQ